VEELWSARPGVEARDVAGPMGHTTWVIERVIRVASSFEEAEELDRQDVAAMSFEERISGVERLRRVWFGEDRAQSTLERVLVGAHPAACCSPVLRT
jgi:hypothetical protein